MLQAKLNNGTLLTLINRTKKEIDDFKRKGISLYCPTCHEPVFIKAGTKMIPHFAHYRSSDCPSNERGEGKYHEQGKFLLYRWLTSQGLDVSLEKYIPSIQQRPDLLLQVNNKHIALEYQCAKISTAEIQNRNKGYQSLGIIPIWILGANRLERQTNLHFKVDTFTEQLIHQYSSTSPSVLYYFCPNTFQFLCIQDLIFTRKGQALGKWKIADIRNLDFKDLFSSVQFNYQERYSLWLKEKKHFRLKTRNRVYGSEFAWQQWLYLKGMHIEYMPSVIHLPISSQFRMKSSLWDWQSRICLDILEPLEKGSMVTFQKITAQLRKHLKPTPFFLLVNSEIHPIQEYLQILVDLEILKNLPNGAYQKVKSLTYYKHVEDAIKGDAQLIKKMIAVHENKIQA